MEQTRKGGKGEWETGSIWIALSPFLPFIPHPFHLCSICVICVLMLPSLVKLGQVVGVSFQNFVQQTLRDGERGDQGMGGERLERQFL